MKKYEVETLGINQRLEDSDGGFIFNTYKQAKEKFNKIIKDNKLALKSIRENIKEYGEKDVQNYQNYIDEWNLIEWVQINRFHDNKVERLDSYEFNVDDLRKMLI